jgi:hypothetical protein
MPPRAKPIELTDQQKLALKIGKHEAIRRKARRGDISDYLATQWPWLSLDNFQRDILDSLFDPTIPEVFVKGNTGCGKSAAAGIAIAAYFDVWDGAKVVVTSAQFQHAKAVMFGEAAKWYRKRALKFPDLTPSGDTIRSSEEHYVQVVNPTVDEGFSGRHSPHTLFCFDEASAIADSRFKMATTQATKLLVMSNPRTVFGAFRQAFAAADPDKTQTILTPRGRRRLITIGGLDCRNVREKRLENPISPPGGIEIEGRRFEAGEVIPEELFEHVKPIIPGQTCYDTYLALRSDPDPRWAAVFADGKFPDADPEKQLFIATWFDRHTSRWSRWWKLYRKAKPLSLAKRLLHEALPVTGFGLDVGASAHRDHSVLTAGGPKGIRQQHLIQEPDTTQLCGWVIRTVERDYGIVLTTGEHPIGVDVVGVGKGVGDRLSELGCNVVPMRGNDSPEDGRSYENARTERFATFADRLNPLQTSGVKPFAIPDDSLLLAELAAIEREYRGSDGLRFGITPKEVPAGSSYTGQSLRARLGRSPDRADSVSYLWAVIRGTTDSLTSWIDAL